MFAIVFYTKLARKKKLTYKKLFGILPRTLFFLKTKGYLLRTIPIRPKVSAQYVPSFPDYIHPGILSSQMELTISALNVYKVKMRI